MAKPKAFPKSLGACADLLYQMRTKRLEAVKAAAELKAEENRLKEHIINTLPKDSGGAVGKTHKVIVVTKTKQQVKDWDKFWVYVAKNKAWDLLQKRISDTAVQARIDDGKKLPGVEPFVVVDVSLTKK